MPASLPVALLPLLTVLLADPPRPAAEPVDAGKTPATSLPPALVEKFRRIRALTADFREEKRMAILVAPLVRTGTLSYEAPDHLAQVVAHPTPSRVVLAGKRLTIGEGAGKPATVIDIEQQPAVGMLVRLLLGVLAGDVSTLQAHTRIAFQAAAGKGAKSDAWSLELVPVDPLLLKLVQNLRVKGRGAIVDELVVLDRSGDQTVTRFSNVKLLPGGFTAKERAARFGS
jgi:hypothetical protein